MEYKRNKIPISSSSSISTDWPEMIRSVIKRNFTTAAINFNKSKGSSSTPTVNTSNGTYQNIKTHSEVNVTAPVSEPPSRPDSNITEDKGVFEPVISSYGDSVNTISPANVTKH